MREFFKGWKRKLGCVTLVIACVFASVWLRSMTVADHIDIQHNKRLYMLNSRIGKLVYCQFEQDCFPNLQPVGIATHFLPTINGTTGARIAALHSLTPTPPMTWTTSSTVVGKFEGMENVPVITHRGFFGIEYVVRKTPRIGDFQIGQQFVILTVHYWSVVLPLTLLSTWLLFVKPRRAKSTPDL